MILMSALLKLFMRHFFTFLCFIFSRFFSFDIIPGIKGDLIQNTYFDFAQISPFISPTLDIRPSSTPYKVVIGTKGKLSQTIGYDLSGSYAHEKNKALFRTQSIKNLSAFNNYNQGNSFEVVYDDIEVLNISGALEIEMNQNLNMRLKGDFFKFTSDAAVVCSPTYWCISP